MPENGVEAVLGSDTAAETGEHAKADQRQSRILRIEAGE
jgi:hypothetical protein